MAQTKATKKFEKKHLGDALKKRKEGAKIKQRMQVKAKKKARRSQEVDSTVDTQKIDSKSNQFEHMTVDEFFQGGFEIPEKPKAKRKRTTSSQEKAHKRRKSSPDEALANESDEPHTQELPSENSAFEAESDDEDDDVDAHKGQLKDLAKKDPEFYKYLQENDAELLDFEDGDFPGIDDLSDDDQSAGKPRNGKLDESDDDDSLDAKNIVTTTLVENWKSAMTEKNSLRSTKEIILAFRAAAHLNQGDGKEYKYTITDSDGMFLCLRFEKTLLTVQSLPQDSGRRIEPHS
jgi:nucleolar complex protein 2